VTGGRRPLPPPRKRFAQHFLSDPRILGRIADALQPDASSTVLEIGPGRGALTRELVKRAGRVTAIEIDRDLADHLRQEFADDPRVQIVEGDALRVAWSELVSPPFLLAGNLPYNLTTPLLFKALEPPLPRRAVFLVQREVADRIVAPEGGKEYGALSVNVRVAMEVSVVTRVPAGAFQPRPAVDSAVIRFVPRQQPLLAGAELRAFREFVQSVFTMRRKQLQRVLRALGVGDADQILATIGVEPTARPETLSVEGFVSLFRAANTPSGRAGSALSDPGS
jgi:16S rRNA (adenine1518-N6/adenine1519-N6)-dimethyltransferase